LGPVITLTDFDCSESMVAAAEARWGVRFSTLFRQYLLELAKSPSTCFKKTDSLNLAESEQFWVDGLELLAQTNPALILSPEAVVFLILQGYMFVHTVAMGLDEPVDRIGIGATAECARFFGHSG
jgi:hypothetical protein